MSVTWLRKIGTCRLSFHLCGMLSLSPLHRLKRESTPCGYTILATSLCQCNVLGCGRLASYCLRSPCIQNSSGAHGVQVTVLSTYNGSASTTKHGQTYQGQYATPLARKPSTPGAHARYTQKGARVASITCKQLAVSLLT